VKVNDSVKFKIKDMFILNLSMLKKIFWLGTPFAAEQMFFNGGKILTQIFIVSLGTYAMDTNAICNSIVGLSQIPANAIALTTITVVGQCMGRKNINDARKFTRSFLMMSSVSILIMSIIIITSFNPLVSLFHPPSTVVLVVFKIILINAVPQILLWSFSFITPSALRAAGDAKFTFVVAMLSMWLFRVVLGYVFGIVFKFGIIGIWIAMDCEWGVRSIIFLYRFHGNRWYKHHVID
jgi:Na+-driven multidrug efflux pump